MSAALSSPTSRTEDSLLSAAPPRSLPVVSTGDSQQASQLEQEGAIDELSASVMDLPDSEAGGDQPPASTPAVAPGPISEEGSSAHENDSGDVVMEGTAEPEENHDRMVAEGSSDNVHAEESGEQRNDGATGTAQDAAAPPPPPPPPAENPENPENPENTSNPTSEGNNTANEANPAEEGDDSDDDDDAASQASSDYDHRFFLENFQEDTSAPNDDETAEMEKRKAEQISALDTDHWAKQSFTQLASNSDPEYEILPEIHQLKWDMTPFHGTVQNPNRTPFSRSPPIKVTNHDGKEYSFGLKVYPHGNDGTEMVSVYLECFEHGKEPQSSYESGSDDDAGTTEKPWWEITAQVGCVIYNPLDPSIHASQKAAHQFTSINPDFGWTRFCGPWTELHKRKHLQERPMLQRDMVSFVVYIRLVKDATRALWWHNVQDHRTDWSPVLKTGYRGYHIESQPAGYSALISALAVWFEIPAFRELVESARIPDAYQSPLESYQILLMALKKALHDKAAPKDPAVTKRLTYLDNVHTALIKNGHPILQNPLDIWETIKNVLEKEVVEAESKGHGSQQLFKSFFDNIKIVRYSIEPAFPTCSELEDQSNAGSGSEMSTEPPQPPTTVQGVISLAKADDGQAPDMLHVELPRQTYDPDRRRWKKVTTKIEIEETVRYQDEEYKLFGLLSHSGELGNLRFNPILRPRGPGTQWLRWSTRCNHTNRGFVVPQTQRQAVESHQGSGTSSTVAYVAVYIKTRAFESMVSGMVERELHDVYNPLPPLTSQTVEEPERFKVVVHTTASFAEHTDKTGFIDPWAVNENDLVLELAKQDSIFDLRNQIRTLDAYKDQEFGLYRLLLNNNNHRLDPQVREEKLENDVFISGISSTYGIHFLLHTLTGEHAKAAQEQHAEIAQAQIDDANRDVDTAAEKIAAERDALYQASLPPPEPAAVQDPPPPPPPAPVVQEPASNETGDGDVVMSGTEEAEAASPGPVAPAAENQSQSQPEVQPDAQPETQQGQQPESQPEPQPEAPLEAQQEVQQEMQQVPQPEVQPEAQPESQTTLPETQAAAQPDSSGAEVVAADAMEAETSTGAQSDQQCEAQVEKPKRSVQLLDATKMEGKTPVELISCMSEEGRTLLQQKLGRPLLVEEGKSRTLECMHLGQGLTKILATASFAARYAGENRIHYYTLVPTLPGATGPVVDIFNVQKVDFVAMIETVQKPHNHALVFVKHYFPSKTALESASAMLLSRDSILKEALKRPSSTNELLCYLETPGDAPSKLRGDASLDGNSIATGCVLITDPVMPELMSTTLTKRGLPSSVTDFLKPQTGFTTGFGRGWADCETLHGRAHGNGRIIYTDGDAYEGALVSGRRSGKGTMYYASGNTYRGDWRDDLPNGKGVIVYADTLNKYDGPFKDGRPHGSGGTTYWKKAEAGARICRICLDEEMNSVLIPCGHMVVCTGCGGQLNECPVCRSSIDRIQRVWDCSQT